MLSKLVKPTVIAVRYLKAVAVAALEMLSQELMLMLQTTLKRNLLLLIMRVVVHLAFQYVTVPKQKVLLVFKTRAVGIIYKYHRCRAKFSAE